MLVRGFWDKLEKPIIGLSPMDGVTDAAFRYIVSKYSKPSLTMTEFTNVEGLARGSDKMLIAFMYDEIERPAVAQIYGVEVESYYKAGVMLCALGFDGIDINMGCPANKVARKGSGAGLIQTPELAKELIRTTKRACKDWSEGITMKEAGVHPRIIKKVKEMLPEGKTLKNLPRNEIAVSVKTRIGFDCDVAVEWTKHLMEELPANISMHGRTLRQMYMGQADWEVIAKAGQVTKGTGVSYLGNGDVKSLKDAHEKIKKYDVDGVLIGRATFGNPWFFEDKEVGMEERMETLLDHCKYFEDLNYAPFHNIRKHLAWYCKEFEGAREMRKNLMQTENFKSVKEIVESFSS